MSAHTAEPEGRIDYAKTLDLPTTRLILLGVLLGLFLSALDQTIVSTALPRITQELNGLSLYSWVATAYLLTNTALVPIYGKLSDLYGRKPILMIGIVIFLIGSALCGLAGEPFLGNLFGGGMMQLVVFRGLQGVGAAALGSVAFAIIADLFEPVDRPRYQGLFGAVFQSDGAMFGFFRPERRQRASQFGFRLGQRVDLRAVMGVDRFLDRDGAGHGGLFAHGGGHGAQCKAREVPERQQGRRAHAAVGDQCLEGVEVDLFLIAHVADQIAFVAAPQHRKLPGVNARRAVLSGVIDADHPLCRAGFRGIAG